MGEIRCDLDGDRDADEVWQWFPFHRLERLEANLGISLRGSTQWEMARDGAQLKETAFEGLIRQAASGDVLTTVTHR